MCRVECNRRKRELIGIQYVATYEDYFNEYIEDAF